MKHEVDTWVQAVPSSRCDRTEAHNDAPIPTSTLPPANSPTSHSARTSDPFSQIQPSTAATEAVRDKGTCPEITMIGKSEGTANPSRHQPCTPITFPRPSNDSTRTLDRHAREGCPSPYLTRRCPVCFGTSAAEVDNSRYVIFLIWALAYQ